MDAFHVASLMIRHGVSKLCLAGFSFGGSIAARLIQKIRKEGLDVEVIDLIRVAPAVENFPIEQSALGNVPRTVIYNEDDDVVDPQAIHAYAIGVHTIDPCDNWRPLLSWRAYSFEGGDFISLSQAGHFMTRIPASQYL